MATFDFAGLRDGAANELLIKFGESGVIRRDVGGAYTPGVSYVSGSDTDYTAQMVVAGKKKRLKDGTILETEEDQIIVGANGLMETPAVDDRIVIGGETFHIQSVEAIPGTPGSTVVAYDVRARKA